MDIARMEKRAFQYFTMTQGYFKLKSTSHCINYKTIFTNLYTDTMFARSNYLRKNSCAQIYVSTFHQCDYKPIQSKYETIFT